MSDIRPAEGFEYYTNTIYWNDFALVRDYINLAISGSAEADWMSVVKRTCGQARRLFVPNCGNGWVEREMIQRGLAQSAIGTDINDALLDEATRQAAAAGVAAQYATMDCNDLYLAGLDFDWVVNFAAFHHIAYLDRALRKLMMALPADGYLICFDYTGPHRNQYPWAMWEKVVTANSRLRAEYQTRLVYPHLPTMLHTDPSEAVHSELIGEYSGRYFEDLVRVDVGGCIAYPILYNNEALLRDQHTAEGRTALQDILDQDDAYRQSHANGSLFTFWIGRPRKDVLSRFDDLQAWAQEENKREALARAGGLRYYPPNALELVYGSFAAAGA